MLKRILRYTTYYILCTTLCLALVGCATVYNPATGKKEAVIIDTEEEINIGKNVALEVLKQDKLIDNLKLRGYVQGVGSKIARVSDRQDLQYSFDVLDNKELNAFSLPGGIIFINKGLADVLTEDELACVLAHEVGHVAARHSVKRIQGQFGYQIFINIAALGISQVDPNLARVVARTSSSIFQMILSGYSRQDEFLADKLAVKYSYSAGYNPRGMVTSLQKLKEHSKENTLFKPMVILRSHPYLVDRIRVVEAEIGLLSNGAAAQPINNQTEKPPSIE